MIPQLWLQFGELLRHASPLEVIDVAVVAIVLYQLLRLLRGTQGIQILVGLNRKALKGFSKDEAASLERMLRRVALNLGD